MVGVIEIDGLLQVNVPEFELLVKVTEGKTVSEDTETKLLAIEEEHPVFVFVTTTLYEPGKLKEGLEVVAPDEIPDAGDQL